MVPWIKILAGALALAAIAWAALEIRKEGAEAARQSIERQNNEAADRAHGKRIDYDACLGAGGLWNFAAGECDGPSQRRRP